MSTDTTTNTTTETTNETQSKRGRPIMFPTSKYNTSPKTKERHNSVIECPDCGVHYTFCNKKKHFDTVKHSELMKKRQMIALLKTKLSQEEYELYKWFIEIEK